MSCKASKHPLVQSASNHGVTSFCFVCLFVRWSLGSRLHLKDVHVSLIWGFWTGALPHFWLQDLLKPYKTLNFLFEPASQQSGSRTLWFHRNGLEHDRSMREAPFLGGPLQMLLIGRNIGKYDGYWGWIR